MSELPRKVRSDQGDYLMAKTKKPPKGDTAQPKARKLPFTQRHQDYCIYRVLYGNPHRAALQAGFKGQYGYALEDRADIRARIKQLENSEFKKRAGEILENYKISVQFVDEEVAHRLSTMKHAVGFALLVKTVYQRLHLIESGSRINNVNSQKQQQVTFKNGTVYSVYKAAWLVKKEAELAARAEEEYERDNKLLTGKTIDAE